MITVGIIVLIIGLMLVWIGFDNMEIIPGLIGVSLCITGSLGILQSHYNQYDYFINLDHNNIIIDTDYGERIIINADESIDSVIIYDNI